MPAVTPRLCAIVHSHEISLKRGNRPLFLRHLQQNIRRAIGDLGPARIVQLPGRIMLDLAGHPNPPAVRERLSRVAGIANIMKATSVKMNVSRKRRGKPPVTKSRMRLKASGSP